MKSEPPKWLSIILSVIALVASGLSWWESHRSRRVSEAVNQPYLNASSFNLEVYRAPTVAAASSLSNAIVIRLTMKLKNTGNMTAVVKNLSVEGSVQGMDVADDERLWPNPNLFCKALTESENQNPQDKWSTLDIHPDAEMVVGKSMDLIGECEKQKATLVDYQITVNYTDATTGNPYTAKAHYAQVHNLASHLYACSSRLTITLSSRQSGGLCANLSFRLLP